MSKRAVLLMNLGSPDSPAVGDVARYLKEFLLDERVIDKGPLLRNLLVRGIIVPRRAPKSAEAYASVWTPEGSPLVVTSRRQRALLGAAVGMPVHLAMRYGNPGVDAALDAMRRDGVTDLFVIPLYPQYAMSSWETAVVHFEERLAASGLSLRVGVLQPFYADKDYIAALAASARKHLARPHDHVLFSFHGVPRRHLANADSSHAHCLCVADCCNRESPVQSTCYRHQCLATARLAAAAMGIPEGRWSVSFQSRLGREEWLRPYTVDHLETLARSGVRRLLVLTPAFVSDCLETLEEIAVEGAAHFRQVGGEDLAMVPCLNDHPDWIAFLASKVKAWAAASS